MENNNDFWKLDVVFTGKYFDLFTHHENEEKKDSEYRFVMAIAYIMQGLKTIPQVGDYIAPIDKDDYKLDIGLISGRTFYLKENRILFEIE